METPDSTSRFSVSRRLLKNFGLLLLASGAFLFGYLIMFSRDSDWIVLALFLLGTGRFIYRKLTPKPVQVNISSVVFIVDSTVDEEDLPRDEPRH
jgi:hypothetical protein